MVVKCSIECKPICDFCKYFICELDEEGAYVDDGYCNRKNIKVDASEYCNDFECINKQ